MDIFDNKKLLFTPWILKLKKMKKKFQHDSRAIFVTDLKYNTSPLRIFLDPPLIIGHDTERPG